MKIEAVSTQAQIETVAGLADKIWHEHFTPIIGLAQVDYMLEAFQSKKVITEQLSKDYLYYLFKIDNEYIGYLGVIAKDRQLFLSKFYIASEYRGNGYGRKAVEFLEQLASEKGAHKISLTVNRNNLDTINKYKRMGFEITGTRIQDIGNEFFMDDYMMEKISQSANIV